MHITEKLSNQMKAQFISTDCSDIRRIQFNYDQASREYSLQITFVYLHEQKLLTLQFINVTEFILEKENADTYCFSLGELLFYDEQDGSRINIADELGGFSIICDDVKFVHVEPIYWR